MDETAVDTSTVENTRQPPVLEVDAISKSFGVVRALDAVSLRLPRGAIHGIVGQNGAGKSTLMRILAGVETSDAGTIRLEGEHVRPRSPDHARRLGIRIIHQELALVGELSVAENIALGVEPRRHLVLLDRSRMRSRARELLTQLGHELDVDTKVGTLDIGHQQIVEIAKALAWHAKILILDEPTAALELQDTERLFAVLRRFREQGGTALYVSHRLDELFQICDVVTILRDGRVVETAPIAATSKSQIIRMMIGRPLNEMFPPRATGSSFPPVLEVDRVSGTGLREVSFTARSGRILGVVGLEGSGIREIGKILVGDRTRASGRVVVGGEPAELAGPRAALRAGIVYLSPDRRREGLFPILPLSENVAIGTLDERTHWGGQIDRRAERQLVTESIARLSIRTSGPRQEVQYLSGGNQQKALIARALASRPRIFVFEEPTRGIDVGAKAEIYTLIRGLASGGAAVVVLSNDITEIVGLSDEIVAMFEGRSVATLPGGVPEEEVAVHIV
jgi:ribose transport system ATP-binding protein